MRTDKLISKWKSLFYFLWESNEWDSCDDFVNSPKTKWVRNLIDYIAENRIKQSAQYNSRKSQGTNILEYKSKVCNGCKLSIKYTKSCSYSEKIATFDWKIKCIKMSWEKGRSYIFITDKNKFLATCSVKCIFSKHSKYKMLKLCKAIFTVYLHI